MILEEKESNIFNGEKIQINASGMIGGRGVGDGITIFGSNPNNQGEEGSNMNTGVSSLKPDFILILKRNLIILIYLLYTSKKSRNLIL